MKTGTYGYVFSVTLSAGMLFAACGNEDLQSNSADPSTPAVTTAVEIAGMAPGAENQVTLNDQLAVAEPVIKSPPKGLVPVGIAPSDSMGDWASCMADKCVGTCASMCGSDENRSYGAGSDGSCSCSCETGNRAGLTAKWMTSCPSSD